MRSERTRIPSREVRRNTRLSDRELDDRLAVLGRERCRVEALLAEAVAEKRRRVGGRAAAATVRERLHVSATQATAEVALAATMAQEFPATLAAWRAGEITAGHARVIARVGSDPDHADEAALLKMAKGVPVDLFGRMTRQYGAQSDSCAEHARQHANRWASLVQDPDGSWRLTAYYGYDTGKRISLAFNQMVRTYRNRVAVNGIDRTNSGTPQQRRADALANLITGEGPHNRPDTTLLVIADYDTVTRELNNLRYDDGHARPSRPDRQAGRTSQDPARHLQHRRRPAVARPGRTRRQHRPAHRARSPRRRLRQLRRSRRGRRAPPHRMVQPGRTHRHRQPRAAVRTLPPPHTRRRMATAPPQRPTQAAATRAAVNTNPSPARHAPPE